MNEKHLVVQQCIIKCSIASFLIIFNYSNSEIVLFLVNNKDISIGQLFILISNIHVLNELKSGDTIQWSLEHCNFACNCGIISELNINPKIILLSKLNDEASSSTSKLNGTIIEENFLKYVFEIKFSKYPYGHSIFTGLTKR